MAFHRITEAVPGLDDRIAEELCERIVKHYSISDDTITEAFY
jgi:hypothetical protein